MDGLTYTGVPGQISASDWLRLLRDGTPSYAAQPYQQLADGCLSLGHVGQARGILMARRDDQLARTYTRWPEQLWGKFIKITLGYGYQPWRALLFLAALVTLTCDLTIVLGSHGALVQTASTAHPGRPCTVLQEVSVGLALNLPSSGSIAQVGCGLTRNPTSGAAVGIVAAIWILAALAWVFAALTVVLSFNSAVRKT